MFQPIFDRLKQIEEEISDIALNIRKITGNSQDTYRDWDILMYIPNLDTTMYQIADELQILPSGSIRLLLHELPNHMVDMQKVLIELLCSISDNRKF